jgi:hypothetical protein
LSVFRLDSVVQKLDINYSRNDGKFVIFIEDTNWNADGLIAEAKSLICNISCRDPTAAFYNALLKSMGKLFKLELSNSIGACSTYFYGKTSVSMPFLDTIIKTQGRNGLINPTVVLEIAKILENARFFQHVQAGEGAGTWFSCLH